MGVYARSCTRSLNVNIFHVYINCSHSILGNGWFSVDLSSDLCAGCQKFQKDVKNRFE